MLDPLAHAWSTHSLDVSGQELHIGPELGGNQTMRDSLFKSEGRAFLLLETGRHEACRGQGVKQMRSAKKRGNDCCSQVVCTDGRRGQAV